MAQVDFRREGDAVTFWVRVKPRSSRERLKLNSAGELQLELHAAPVEGQANAACVEFFANLLHLPRSAVEIVAGEKSRRKLLRVRGGEEVVQKIRSAAGLSTN